MSQRCDDLDTSDAAIALTAEERAEELAFDIGTATGLMGRAEVARAVLPVLSLDLLVRECQRRGHQVCLHEICGVTKRSAPGESLTEDMGGRFRYDRLPPGYPPLADGDEELPFGGEDRRE